VGQDETPSGPGNGGSGVRYKIQFENGSDAAEAAAGLDTLYPPADDRRMRLGSERLVGKTGSRLFLAAFIVLLGLAAVVFLRVAPALSG